MPTAAEQAQALFGPQYSCAQAILMSFAPGLGLDQDQAARLARGLGMGMAQGLVCGAVSGAMLVLGLAQGPRQAEERAPRFACYKALTDFCKRFEEVHGSITCRDLLGVDLGTAQGRAEAQERGLFMSLCPRYVQSAAEILQQML